MDFSPYVAYSTSVLRSGMHTRAELERLCAFNAKDLRLSEDINPYLLLMTLAGVESSFGENIGPRYESSYGRLSIAYKRNAELREGFRVWGDLCAMSYGTHQIMWAVARSLGYPLISSPVDLSSSVVSLPYVVELINQDARNGAKTLDQIAIAYNAGLSAVKDLNRWPTKYLEKFRLQYSELQSKLVLGGYHGNS